MSCSWARVKLGSTNLEVVPLGLAASYGIEGKEAERAFNRGLNLFYWGALRAPVFPRPSDFGRALKRIAHCDREKVVTVIQSYARSPRRMTLSIEKGLRELHLDYTDVLLLGWWNLTPPERLLDAAAKLVQQYRARYVMVSCHNRPAFPILARDPRVSLLMIRYNAAHPGAELDVFPHLPTERPGIVAYTATSWEQLLNPALIPAGERVPTAADCYRFALSSPYIDACFTGAKTGAELDGAMRALDLGPMNDEELVWMRRVGSSVRQRTQMDSKGRAIFDRFVNLASGFGFRPTDKLPRNH
ncbi:MAG: aldo/keto reductase [Acidobacteria bacterium]|nr:aldo/keto reductase [Acidobacteriota bacterium]